MSKFCSLTEENAELIRKIAEDTGMYQFMHIEGIGVPKAKDLITVKRETTVTEYKTKKPDTVNVFIYERAFDMLDDDNKEILLRDAFNNINYDSEKDKILIGAPRITVTIDGRAKWGNKLINAAESGVLIMQKIEQDEKEKRQQELEEKRNKRKKK